MGCGKRTVLFGTLLLTIAIAAAAQEKTILSADYGAGDRDRIDVTQRLQSMAVDRAVNFVLSNDSLGVPDPAHGLVKELWVRVREYDGRISIYRFREGGPVNIRLRGGHERTLMPEVQRQYDGYYTRWLESQRRHDRYGTEDMERHMRQVMYENHVPPDTPFDYLASPGLHEPSSGWGRLRIERATYGTESKYVDVTDRVQAFVRDNSIQMQVTSENLGGDPARGQLKRLNISYSYQGQRQEVTVDEKRLLTIP